MIKYTSKVKVRSNESLALIYTPGVAKSCLEIKENPDRVFDLTNRSNSIGIMSYNYEDAYKRAEFFKKTKNVDCYPLEIKKTTKEDLDFVIQNIMPNFMGVDTSLIEGKEYNAPLDIPTRSKACIYEDKIEKLEPVMLRELFGGVVETTIDEEKEEIIKPTAIISDGSAVLGLGNIGAICAIPVMEGKAVLFEELGDVPAISLCLQTQNKDEIIKIVQLLENSFSSINLEDICAPKCFEIERELIKTTSIPIFHDDQHGTAIVVLAGLLNALEVVNKRNKDIKIVISGAGAAGLSICKLLLKTGFSNITLCNINGVVYTGNPLNDPELDEVSKSTNKDNLRGTLKDAIINADVFIGVSAPNIMTEEMVKTMAKDPIVFALANPTPEIMPDIAKNAGAKIVASGRSDFDNQINNCLAFPGIFKGVLESKCKVITDEIKVRCAVALAHTIEPEELDENYIIPEALDHRVAKNISACIIDYVRNFEEK
ncbi:MAG: NADP-dependent malic enzyme [Cyanobacteria bacterium SIG30]|nr:NADP-dependent malic enzyme [Cyanobacteria bacterium SIG30]